MTTDEVDTRGIIALEAEGECAYSSRSEDFLREPKYGMLELS